MVKLIVDFCEAKIGTEVAFFKDCVLLIDKNCDLIPEIRNSYKEGSDIDASILSGNHYFYVSDDFQRGLLIGRAIFQFPSVIILSSRPEVLARYLGKFSENIRYWSKNTEFIQKNEEITLKGPNPPQVPFNNPVQDKKVNPKPFILSSLDSASLSLNKFEKSEEKEEFSALIQRNPLIEESKSLPISTFKSEKLENQPSSADLQKNPELTPIFYEFSNGKLNPQLPEAKFVIPTIDDNCEVITKYLEEIVVNLIKS